MNDLDAGPWGTPEEALSQARRAGKIRQVDLAKVLGVCRVQVSNWERGHSRMPGHRIAQVADTLNVDLCVRGGLWFVTPVRSATGVSGEQ